MCAKLNNINFRTSIDIEKICRLWIETADGPIARKREPVRAAFPRKKIARARLVARRDVELARHGASPTDPLVESSLRSQAGSILMRLVVMDSYPMVSVCNQRRLCFLVLILIYKLKLLSENVAFHVKEIFILRIYIRYLSKSLKLLSHISAVRRVPRNLIASGIVCHRKRILLESPARTVRVP